MRARQHIKRLWSPVVATADKTASSVTGCAAAGSTKAFQRDVCVVISIGRTFAVLLFCMIENENNMADMLSSLNPCFLVHCPLYELGR